MKRTLLRGVVGLMASLCMIPSVQADNTSYLTEAKGYTKLTAMPGNLSDYYFVIVDRDKDLMMTLGQGANQGSDKKTWYYKNSVDPTTDLNMVWEIEANGGGHSFRNVDYDILMMQTEYKATHNFRTNDQPSCNSWTKFNLTYNETDAWTIENDTYKGNYVGTWAGGAPVDGSEVAANKTVIADVGHYYIYSISRGDFMKNYVETNKIAEPINLTPFIEDENFEMYGWSKSWGLKWNGTGTDKQTAFARQTSSQTGFTGAFAEMYGTLGACDLNQSLRGLPKGVYVLSAYALSDVESTLYAKSGETVLGSCAVNNRPISKRRVGFTIEADNTDVTIGFSEPGSSSGGKWVAIDRFELIYVASSLSELQERYKALRDEVSILSSENTMLTNNVVAITTGAYSNLDASSDVALLQGAIELMEESKVFYGYTQSAYASYQSYKDILDNSMPKTEEAGSAYSNVVTAAKASLDAATTKEELDNAIATLEPARRIYVCNAYPTNGTTFDMDFLMSSWQGNSGTYTSGGVAMVEKFEKQPYTGDVMWANYTGLPEGVYRVEVYCNASAAEWHHSSNITNGDETLTKIYGSSGVVVPVPAYKLTSVASPSVRTLENVVVVTDGQLNMTIRNDALGANWIIVANKSLRLVSAIGDDQRAGVKNRLGEYITDAQNVPTVNLGEEVFQIPTSAKTALDGVVSDATKVYNSESATLSELIEQCNKVCDGVANYNNATLNAPAEGDVFNFYITTTDSYGLKERNATFSDDGEGVTFFTAANRANAPYFAQTMMFKQVVDNKYTISTVDANGVTRYVCTIGKKEGSTDYTRIRLTDDPAKALAIQIIPSTTQAGVYNLLNTEANALLGCQTPGDQDGGLFTVGVHNDFCIKKTTLPSVSLSTKAGYATLILPFKATIPEGLKVYTCNSADGTTLQLDEVEGSELAANTPYIVQGSTSFSTTFEGFGAATATTYPSGWLTGTYVSMDAPVGSYVLQKQNETVAFYHVVAEAQPTVGAYRAYLTTPSSEVNAFMFPTFGEETANIAVKAADRLVDVVTLNGVILRKGVKASEALDGLKPGLYIVDGMKRVIAE